MFKKFLMSIIKYIKNYIPIIFGILFIIGCFVLSIFAFLGKYPFNNKSNKLGILFLLLFLFGFYFGMLIGNFINFLLNICINDNKEDILLKMPIKKKITLFDNNINNKKNKITRIIDF